jgi:hypothetical protein
VHVHGRLGQRRAVVVAAAASVWNAHDTPAELTPFHRFVLTVTCRAIDRNGFPLPCAVRMIDGSMNTGMP